MSGRGLIVHPDSSKLKKFRCVLVGCNYLTDSYVKLRNHVIRHNCEEIYDYSFENGLMVFGCYDPSKAVGEQFSFLLNRICERGHE